MTDQDPMPFGKHKDILMANVSPRYLLFLYENNYIPGKYPEVKQYIEANLDVIKKEVKTKEQDEANRKYGDK